MAKTNKKMIDDSLKRARVMEMKPDPSKERMIAEDSWFKRQALGLKKLLVPVKKIEKESIEKNRKKRLKK